MKYLISLILSLTLLIACSSTNEPINDEQILRKQIGQMLMIGFRGFDVDTYSPITQDIINERIAGVILFDRDVALASWDRNIQSPEQVKLLNNKLQSFAKTPLFIAVDQEGGRVARLKESYGFPSNVSQQYLGELDNIDSTIFYANQTANTLKEVGFNINFAPVVDLNLNPENPVIGAIERSFSSDPNIVVKHSRIILDEFYSNDIIGTLKHFPGHGSSHDDSHLGLTDVTNYWQEIELEPYKALINEGKVQIIMTAHIYNANLDKDYPATLSQNILTGILRGELGYNGVIVSDDMNMKAITDYYGLETAIELAINAGVDILLFANNLFYDEQIAQKATDIIVDLVYSGKISRHRINESYERVLELKNKNKLIF